MTVLGKILAALGVTGADALIAEHQRTVAAYAELNRVLDTANRFGEALVMLKAGLAERGFTPAEGPAGLVTAALAIIDRVDASEPDAVTDVEVAIREHLAAAWPNEDAVHIEQVAAVAALAVETHPRKAEHGASAGPDTTPQHSDPWRLAEWNRLPDRCLIAACEGLDIDQRGPIFLSDQSMRKACTEHWEAITRVLGDQASWERVDAWSPHTPERKS